MPFETVETFTKAKAQRCKKLGIPEEFAPDPSPANETKR
jgi:hypothetical protein